MPRTYQPDNTGIGISLINGGLRAAQRVETATGIAKEIEVVLDQGRPRAIVVHRLRNCGLWPVELSPWALTAMAPGGAAVLPLPLARRHEDQLTPTHAIVLWAYSDMSDPRWTWGPQHVILRQDPACSAPQKTGVRGGPGWIAYVANGVLFLKTVTVHRGASYADLGCAIESFTNSEMLEIETLGPTVVLLPGGVVEHTETWILQANVRLPVGDPDITRDILPLISS